MSDPSTDELREYMTFAHQIAQEAGTLTLEWFRKDPETQYKADRTPVTVADRAAERLLRERIRDRFPDHSILGEEDGFAEGSAEWTWVLDPIDGTISYVLGVPLYAVLVALVRGRFDGRSVVPSSDVVAGAICIPPLQETVWAGRGLGAFWTVHGTLAPARVSTHPSLSGARVGTTDFSDFLRRAPEVFNRLSTAAMTRTWGDAYGYLLVATGRHEAMIDPIVSPWDLGPLSVIIEEAGGRFTTLEGDSVLGSSVLASNGLVHEELLGR